MLSAEELLKHRIIKNTAWDEWEKLSKTLPKTGKKQFEPNGSTLQNMQIDKGIKHRFELLDIERVERACQLAIAEWLPAEQKARVLKKSGQDWANFGTEINASLYLIPEEALFLLELNCLELMWNGVSLSVQQAYELLIDNTECSLEEYRVYSQLMRYGYRVQRFVYDQLEKNSKAEEINTPKRKVIVHPENGLRMSDAQSHSHECTKGDEHSVLEKRTQDAWDGSIVTLKSSIEDEIYKTLEDIISRVEQDKTDYCKAESKCGKNILHLNTAKENDISRNRLVNSFTPKSTNGADNHRTRSSKVEIISEQRLVGDIKIVKDSIDNFSKSGTGATKWPGARIQRNVKLLPKRNDKSLSSDISVIDPHNASNSFKSSVRPKELVQDEPPSKKSKQEVIEISDDEIQELPCILTRMELLNFLPNIANQLAVTERIPKEYIPPGIKLQKKTYHYTRGKLLKMHEIDSKARSLSQNSQHGTRQNIAGYSGTTAVAVHENRNNMFHRVNLQSNFSSHGLYSARRGQRSNFNYTYQYNNRIPLQFNFNHNTYWHNRGTFIQQNVFQNTLNYISFENQQNSIQRNTCFSVMKNDFMVPYMGNNTMKHSLLQNQFRPSLNEHFSQQLRFCQQRIFENRSVHHSMNRNYANSAGSHHVPHNNRNIRRHQENAMYISSFSKYPDSSSWAELKQKWRDEKTITIDDEDVSNKDNVDSSEIEIVQQFVNPLVGPKHSRNLAEIYERLRIIKTAPEKTVRKKRGNYKISYKVYSSTSIYRKANPGPPLYCIVIIRRDDNFLVQPIELLRLQQDANGSSILLAHVSMSISYVQPGFVSVPNMGQ